MAFEYLEHTADIYIAAYGENLEEAFQNAAKAMFNVMTDIKTISPQIEDQLEVEAHDEEALLYDWLEDLLIKFETMGNLYSRFRIPKIERRPQGLKFKAKIWGEPFNPEKHTQKVGIKAVTYHRMEILKEPEKITIKFILDI